MPSAIPSACGSGACPSACVNAGEATPQHASHAIKPIGLLETLLIVCFDLGCCALVGLGRPGAPLSGTGSAPDQRYLSDLLAYVAFRGDGTSVGKNRKVRRLSSAKRPMPLAN